MVEKDPKKITLKEAAELYNKEIGTSKIATFGEKGKLKKYGNISLVDAFKGEQGSRIIDEMFKQAETPGTYNKLAADLRLIAIPVRRRISRSNSNDPILNTLPGLEAADEQTKIIFGEKKAVSPKVKVAIDTTKRKGWKEFFDQIDAIADDPNNPKQALANAFRTSAFSGNRIGLMTGLQGSEYLVDQGAISVEPQTKQSGVPLEEQETRTGASKTGGFREEAITYTVPLNENGHAYLQQQLKINANDPEIKAFLQGQAEKGKAPIFVHKIVTGEGDKRKVKFVTGDKLNGLISNMLADIKVSENIIVDNKSKKGYNSLFPKEIQNKSDGKWGSALSRNIHASIAINEVRVDQQMIDFLHGRSLKSGAAERGATAKLGYADRPVGVFFPSERNAQQSVGNWINEVQGKTAAEIPDVQTTVSKANYAIEGFFDPPQTQTTGTPAIDKKSDVVAKILSGEISIADQMAAWRAKKKGGTPNGGGKTGAAIIGGLSVGSALMAGDAEAGLETGTQMIGEEALERGTIELLKKAGLAARSANPLGAGLTIAGSTVSTIGDQAFDRENRVAQQLGISRADLIKLPQQEKDKLYSLLGEYKREQLAGEQEQISLGEQMRSLSSDSATRPLDSGKIETDPIMDQMISSGQI